LVHFLNFLANNGTAPNVIFSEPPTLRPKMSITDRESAPETNTIEPELDGADVVSRAVAEFEQKLLRYAQLWVGQLDSARDVVQETFLQLHRQIQTQMPQTLAAW
jgi:hypothetical protein